MILAGSHGAASLQAPETLLLRDPVAGLNAHFGFYFVDSAIICSAGGGM
jgi:hypothetical protein